MSQIRFYVDLGESMRRGVSCPTEQPVTVEVDPAGLTEEARKLIGDRLDEDGFVRSRAEDGYFYSRPKAVRAGAPTVDAVVEAIKAEEEAVRTRPERRAAEEKAKEEERLARARRDVAEPMAAGYTRYLALFDTGAVADLGYRYRDAGVVQLVAYEYQGRWLGSDAKLLPEGVELAARLEAETAAAREAARRDAEAEARALDEPRRAWVRWHGSARLRRLLAEGIHHLKTYEAEHAAWERARLGAELADARPGWVVVAEGDLATDLADVGARAIAVLDAARAAVAGAKLGKLKATGRHVAYAPFTTSYGLTVLTCWPKD
jgi:hypothetical protein